MCCVMSRKHSCMTTKPRSRCPTLPCLLASFPASARQREANCSDSSTAEWSARVATRWCMGALGSTARSLMARCQTNLVLSVRSGIFPSSETERQRSIAVGKWPCSRLLPMSWPGGASRPIACPRRQAKPRAVYLRCLARAKHRGLLLACPGEA